MKAIETVYAGCRFRSRLEARWAVFFDQLGISWEYEPEGFEFHGHRYLPDFWLPNAGPQWGSGTYVEVKGSDDQLTQDYKRKLGWAIDYHSTPLSHHGLLLLGPIPHVANREIVGWSHLRWAKGVQHDLVTWDASHSPVRLSKMEQFEGDNCDGDDGIPADTSVLPVFVEPLQWRRGVESWWQPSHPRIDAAYDMARSARFEFGESGPRADPLSSLISPTWGSNSPL